MPKSQPDILDEFYTGSKIDAAAFKYRRIVDLYEKLDNAEEFLSAVGNVIGSDSDKV
jgi:hypothetical protein